MLVAVLFDYPLVILAEGCTVVVLFEEIVQELLSGNQHFALLE
jgi:hypothetical protein